MLYFKIDRKWTLGMRWFSKVFESWIQVATDFCMNKCSLHSKFFLQVLPEKKNINEI